MDTVSANNPQVLGLLEKKGFSYTFFGDLDTVDHAIFAAFLHDESKPEDIKKVRGS